MVLWMEDAMRIRTPFNLIHWHKCTSASGGVSRASGQKKSSSRWALGPARGAETLTLPPSSRIIPRLEEAGGAWEAPQVEMGRWRHSRPSGTS